MKIIVTKDYDELSARAARLVVTAVRQQPTLVLGLATGQTPLGFYQQLVNAYWRGQISWAGVTTFNLDEYVGLRQQTDSFWSYMRTHFFNQVDIKPERINFLNGQAASLTDECANYERAIQEAGGLDLQILGLGLDGHIGFCEPGTAFASRTMVVKLTESTRSANRPQLARLSSVPRQALTMGLATIMEARRILLLASGRAKTQVVQRALYGPISEEVPASILQRHNNVLVLLDEAAAGGSNR